MLDADLAGSGDAGERVVDAPDGAQQPDEGRGGAHAGQQHMAELQLVGHPVQGVAQAAGELLGAVAAGRQPAGRRRLGGLDQQGHHRLALQGGQLLARLLE